MIKTQKTIDFSLDMIFSSLFLKFPSLFFYTGSYDHTCRLWNVQTGEVSQIIPDFATLQLVENFLNRE